MENGISWHQPVGNPEGSLWKDRNDEENKEADIESEDLPTQIVGYVLNSPTHIIYLEQGLEAPAREIIEESFKLLQNIQQQTYLNQLIFRNVYFEVLEENEEIEKGELTEEKLKRSIETGDTLTSEIIQHYSTIMRKLPTVEYKKEVELTDVVDWANRKRRAQFLLFIKKLREKDESITRLLQHLQVRTENLTNTELERYKETLEKNIFSLRLSTEDREYLRIHINRLKILLEKRRKKSSKKELLLTNVKTLADQNTFMVKTNVEELLDMKLEEEEEDEEILCMPDSEEDKKKKQAEKPRTFQSRNRDSRMDAIIERNIIETENPPYEERYQLQPATTDRLVKFKKQGLQMSAGAVFKKDIRKTKRDWGINTGRIDVGILKQYPEVTIRKKNSVNRYVAMKTTPQYMILGKISDWGEWIFNTPQVYDISDNEEQEEKEKRYATEPPEKQERTARAPDQDFINNRGRKLENIETPTAPFNSPRKERKKGDRDDTWDNIELTGIKLYPSVEGMFREKTEQPERNFSEILGKGDDLQEEKVYEISSDENEKETEEKKGIDKLKVTSNYNLRKRKQK